MYMCDIVLCNINIITVCIASNGLTTAVLNTSKMFEEVGNLYAKQVNTTLIASYRYLLYLLHYDYILAVRAVIRNNPQHVYCSSSLHTYNYGNP